MCKQLISIVARLLVGILCISPLLLVAQDATNLLNDENLAAHPPVTVLTLTASQGDGTTCTIKKVAASSIYLALSCVSGGASDSGETLKATGAVVSSTTFGYGDALCLLMINPTATAIAAIGSWPAIPAVSVGWQCSTNIRTGGAAGPVSGQTAIVTGTVSWP